MPEIPNVVSGEPVESDWGNDIRDRSVQKYADLTALDFSQPIPQLGEMAWLHDPGHLVVCTGQSPSVWTAVLDDITGVRITGDTMTGDLRLDGANIEVINTSHGIRFVTAYIVDDGGSMTYVHPSASVVGHRFLSGGADSSDQMMAIDTNGVRFGPDAHSPTAQINPDAATDDAIYGFNVDTTSGLGRWSLGCALYGNGNVRALGVDNNGRVYMPALGAGSFPDVLSYRASDGLVTTTSAAALLQPLVDQVAALQAQLAALQATVDSL